MYGTRMVVRVAKVRLVVVDSSAGLVTVRRPIRALFEQEYHR